MQAVPLLAALAGSAIIGLGLARGAVLVQIHWSPILLFPLILGAVCGGAVTLLLRRFWPDTGRATLASCALLAAVVLAVAQHYFSYGQYRNNYEANLERNAQVQMLKQAFGELQPMGFFEFLQFSARARQFGPWELHGGQVWCSWIVDGLLIVAAAGIAAIWLSRRQMPAVLPSRALE
jgi:hypothetical protein